MLIIDIIALCSCMCIITILLVGVVIKDPKVIIVGSVASLLWLYTGLIWHWGAFWQWADVQSKYELQPRDISQEHEGR